jgi:predicted 2-oxoglutarate/Fe(II)-dependent dioxygenase YbiX
MTVPFVFVGAVLSSRECRLLRNAASVAGWETATILRGSKPVLNKRVRNARVSRLEAPSNEISAIIEKIISTARCISDSAFNISITQPEVVLRIVRYETGGKYKWHIDHGRGIAAHRKISIVVQLSAEKEYTGGGLLIRARGGTCEAPKLQGTVIVFPSKRTVHALQPLSSGIRYSGVLWLSHPTKQNR